MVSMSETTQIKSGLCVYRDRAPGTSAGPFRLANSRRGTVRGDWPSLYPLQQLLDSYPIRTCTRGPGSFLILPFIPSFY